MCTHHNCSPKAKNCNASGVMSDMEYNIYCDFHSFITSSNSGLDIDAIVYLQTTPEVCMSRLKMRNREEEEGAERGMPHTSAHLWQKKYHLGSARHIFFPAILQTIHSLLCFFVSSRSTLTSIPFSAHDMRHTCGTKVCR